MRTLETGEVEEGVLEEDLSGSCKAGKVDDSRRPASELVHGEDRTGEDGDHSRQNEKDQGRVETNERLT
jgi:hypothetical protein